MSLQIAYVTVEMSDGTVFDRQRVTLQDRLRLERSARVNKWELAGASSAPTTNAFLGWSVLERTGQIQTTFEAFIAGEAIDVYVEAAEATLGNPTQPEAGIG